MSKYIPEPSGKIYGHWQVICFDRIDSHGDARFWCKCLVCGDTYSVKGYTIRHSYSTKCKACQLEGMMHR